MYKFTLYRYLQQYELTDNDISLFSLAIICVIFKKMLWE